MRATISRIIYTCYLLIRVFQLRTICIFFILSRSFSYKLCTSSWSIISERLWIRAIGWRIPNTIGSVFININLTWLLYGIRRTSICRFLICTGFLWCWCCNWHYARFSCFNAFLSRLRKRCTLSWWSWIISTSSGGIPTSSCWFSIPNTTL